MPVEKSTVDTIRKERGTVLKEGYIQKLGGNKGGREGNWKRRYLVLCDDLTYFESKEAYEAGEQPKGKVKLDMCFCPEPELEDNETNDFCIYAIPFHLEVRCDSQADLISWASTIQQLSCG
mmetsp:Transcript_16535/g.34528  ORF Transcript_16535/g.34528 Transcript_16535/m.34528 type:complete len:121 (-) Transcript_16535:154-516(-)